MKKLTAVIALFWSLALTPLFAQTNESLPSATIYFVRSKSFMGSDGHSYMVLKDQLRFEVPLGGVVEYKIYSQGEISIEGDYSGFTKLYVNLKIQSGNKYYVLWDFNKFKVVTEKDVKKILDKPNSYEKREESLDTPIIPGSIKK